MKKLIATLILITVATLSCGAQAKEFTLETLQARIDEIKTFMDNIEREVRDEVFGGSTASAENTFARKRFINMLVTNLQYSLAKGEKIDEFEITDLYMCAAGVCGELDTPDLLELHKFFEEADIAENIDGQVLPDLKHHPRMRIHWLRARKLLRIAMRNAI